MIYQFKQSLIFSHNSKPNNIFSHLFCKLETVKMLFVIKKAYLLYKH